MDMTEIVGYMADSHATKNSDGIPDGIIVLGLSESGNPVVYFKGNGQLLTISASKKELSVLGESRLRQIAPVKQKVKDAEGDGFQIVVTGWNAEKAYAILRNAGEKKGLFSVEDARGTGLWPVDGGVHYHDGGGCYVVDGVTYVPDKPGIAPLPGGSAEDGQYLYSLLEKHWGRQTAIRLCGWVVSAMASGAMTWRPHIWVTAPRGTGKGTLLIPIRAILGRAAISSNDFSSAGIKQKTGLSAKALLLDEAEVDGADQAATRRVEGCVALARGASDGGGEGSVGALRGTANGKASSHNLHCSFLFASIFPPVGTAADASRIVPVELPVHDKGTTPPEFNKRELAVLGQRILGRIIADWSGLQSEISEAKTALRAKGRENREADTIGTLSGCARWLTGMPGLEVAGPELRERFEGRDDSKELFKRLLQIPVQGHGSIAMALQLVPSNGNPQDVKAGQSAAEAFGFLKINKNGVDYVAIVCTHDSIKRAMGAGGWSTVLKRIPGSIHERASFAGSQCRAVFVPIAAADDAESPVDASTGPIMTAEELSSLME